MSSWSGQRRQHASTMSLKSNHKPLRRCRGNPPPLRSEPTLVSSSVCGPAHVTLCLLKARRMRSFSFLRGVQQWLPQARTQRKREPHLSYRKKTRRTTKHEEHTPVFKGGTLLYCDRAERQAGKQGRWPRRPRAPCPRPRNALWWTVARACEKDGL